MKKALILAMLLIFPTASRAEAPPWLVAAIIQQESQGNPLAVNVAGRSHQRWYYGDNVSDATLQYA